MESPEENIQVKIWELKLGCEFSDRLAWDLAVSSLRARLWVPPIAWKKKKKKKYDKESKKNKKS